MTGSRAEGVRTYTPPTPESVLRAAMQQPGINPLVAGSSLTEYLLQDPTLASAIALGLAWQRASAALPEGWAMQAVYKASESVDDADWVAVAYGPEDMEWVDPIHGRAPTPEAALIVLAEALEARRGE